MRTVRIVHGGEMRHRTEGDVGHIEGYAVKFNRYSQNLGGYVEQIAPGAATTTIAEKAGSKKNDIRATYNHQQILARQATETLRVFEDEDGIGYEIALNLRVSAHRDVMEMVETELVTGSSFGFRTMPEGETWSLTDAGFPLVTVHNMELFDVGPVDFPAYLDSEAESRDLIRLRSFLVSQGVDASYADLQLRDDADPLNFNSFVKEARARTRGQGPVEATPRLNMARRRLELSVRGR